MADNKMEKSIKEAIGKSLNEFNKRIGMAKLIKDNKNQDRILKGILSQVNDENIEKTEKSNVITLDNSTDGIVELQEIKGDTNVNVSKMEKETPITHVIDDKNGNVISLDGITEGAINIDDIQGNTMVNCNKDTDKELILMPNLDTNGYSNITLTEGIDGGKVDISLEGNTMVNVCDQEDPVAITKSYTVETGNHIALQGEYDGKCRPNIYGNTLVNLRTNNNCDMSISDKSLYTQTYKSNTRIAGTVTSAPAWVYVDMGRVNMSLFKPNTKYTILFNNATKIKQVKLQRGDVKQVYSDEGKVVNNKAVLTTVSNLNEFKFTDADCIYCYLDTSSYPVSFDCEIVGILEGDYTNKPIPNYFTGMKSSFEDKLVPENLLTTSNNGEHITITDTEYILGVDEGEYSILNISTSKTLEQGKTYTVYFNAINNIGTPTVACALYNNNTNLGDYGNCSEAKTLNNNLLVLNCTSECENLRIVQKVSKGNSISLSKKIYLVEGDYTNYDFTNYDSTKGGKYKVDYKVTGKNKCHIIDSNYNKNSNGLTWTIKNNQVQVDGASTGVSSLGINICYPNFINGKTYVTSTSNNNVTFYISYIDNGIRKYCGGGQKTYTHNSNYTDIMCYLQVNNSDITFNNEIINIQLEEGTTATTYEPYKEQVKTLYLNSPLLEGDTIEQSGNNIIHNHRYKEVVLDGSDDENWSGNGDIEKTYYKYIHNNFTNAKANALTSTCDKLPTISKNELKTGIIDNTSTGKIQIGCNVSTLTDFRQYLQQNPITVVYQLAQPTQEIISTNDNLLLDSYTNGHLDVDTVVPIDKVEFKNVGNYLKYLYPSTDYTIQFESDNVGKIDYIYMTNKTVAENINVIKGINKINITTNTSFTSNWFTIIGIGFNASKIVVTPKVDNDFGYFKGMKSVGECEGNKIEILSQNKNLLPKISKSIDWNGANIKILNHTITFTPDMKKNMSMGCLSDIFYMNIKAGTKLTLTRWYVGGAETFTKGAFNVSIKLVYKDETEEEMKPKDNVSSNAKSTITLTKEVTKDVVGFKVYALSYSINGLDAPISYKIQLEINDVSTSFVESNYNKKEILLNEPLRGLPNGVKDKYIIIDGKWYIERNTVEVNMYELEFAGDTSDTMKVLLLNKSKPIAISNIFSNHNDFDTLTKGQMFVQERGGGLTYVWIPTNTMSNEEFKRFLNEQNATIIFAKSEPTYEPIDYNPFEVYTDTTHISNNSNIPCNMVIRNSGFNCILKPNTTYTVSSSNGLSTVTTKDSIGDSVLRFYDKDTTSITKMSKVLVLEGDYITGNPPIPAFFKGMESAFEQELVTDENDEHYGKYKVNIKAVGKNLFDGKITDDVKSRIDEKRGILYYKDSGLIDSARVTDYIRVKPNTTIIYTKHEVHSVQSYAFYDYRKKYITGGYGYPAKKVPSNACYFRVTFDKTKSFQVEQGDTATEYEPYKQNNITFYLNEPLRGVGDIKDKVYVKEDKVVVERNCSSVTFDGSDDEEYIIWENNSKKPSQECFVLLNSMKHIPNIAMSSDGHSGLNYTSNNFTRVNVSQVGFVMQYYISMHFGLPKAVLKTDNIAGFRQYLQNNPTTVVYQLATPVYEEVEYSNNRLTLNTYNNSTLFYNSNIPISNTSFKPLWEELIYIKNSTTYYIQFNAVGNGNVVVNLGGTELTATITEGYNKIEITTPNNATNLLTIDGQGIKISKVIVSEALCSGYYKGLQSCFEEHMENGKYVCVIRGISLDGNKVNGIKFYLNEPLRGIGDIKDRLCIKDGKLMVERKFSSFTFYGSEDENWSSTGYNGHATRNTFEVYLNDMNGYKGITLSISNLFNYENTNTIPINDNAFRVFTNAQNITYFLFTPSTDIIPYRDTNKWKEYLQQNSIKVVYQLATPTYEEVTNEYGLPIILEGYENGIVYVDSSVTPTTSIKYTSNNKVPATLSNVDNLNTTTQNDINNNIVTYMMDIDMMLTEMEMDDSASSVMSLSDFDDNNQNHDSSHNNILDRMNKEDRIKYQDNTTKMLEKVIKGKSLTKEENINRIDLYLSEGKIRKEQSNYLKELLKGVE